MFYIDTGVYFEDLAHTIVETWQVPNLDEVGKPAGDSGRAAV